MLSVRKIRFCQEYARTENGAESARLAGYSEKGAAQKANQLLSLIEVQDYLSELKEEAASLARVTCARIAQEWERIAFADPSELVRVKAASCCRHCWGAAFAKQWTLKEYTKALNKALDAGEPAPDGIGGFDFDETRDSNPDCPNCQGGKPTYVAAASTHRLKGSARRLYAGAKQTKDGIVILMRDQDAALANLAKWRGMVVDKRELSGPGGGPIPVSSEPREMSEEELMKIALTDN